MKAVLNHQSSTPKGKDVLVIDGELSEYIGTVKQVEAQELTHFSKKAKLLKITRLFRLFGASSSLRLYADDKTIWAISNFLNTDEIGRRIAYVFCCDEKDKPAFVKRIFMDYCSIAKMTPSPKDCDAIEKALRFEKNKIRIMFVAVLIAVIIFFVIVLNFK